MLNDDLVYPDYSNSIVNIPNLIYTHFSSNNNKPKSSLSINAHGCSKIVLFVIDGLGFNLWEKEAEKNNFFRKIKQKGKVFKITTTFPSTTAAALTSLSSGITPKEHGLLEWNIYFRELDLILETLPYRVVPTKFHSAKAIPEDPKMLFNGITIYERLTEKNIPTFFFIPRDFQRGVYTRTIAKGAKIVPYVSIADLLVNLRRMLQENGKSYYYVYLPQVDTMEHEYGPYAEQTQVELSNLSYMLENEFISKLDKQIIADTAMLLTSDHGQVPVDPRKTIYLNQFPQVTKFFKKSKSGKPILPTGSSRDVFLSIEESKVEEVIIFLRGVLKDMADVIKIDSKTVISLFGEGREHPEFHSRLGNILILPKGNNTVWYKYMPEAEFHHLGHHGGLTQDEMFVPFIIARMSQLF